MNKQTGKEEFGIRTYTRQDEGAFRRLYAAVFREPPWKEEWTRDQLTEELQGYFAKQRLDFRVAVMKGGDVVGFSVSYEVGISDFPFLRQAFLDRGVDPSSSNFRMAYGDELGVDINYRGRGIAKALVQRRMERYSQEYRMEGIFDIYLIGRTDVDSKMFPIYQKLEYENTAVSDPQYPNRVYFLKRL